MAREMNSQFFPTIAYTDGESEKTEVGFKKTIPFMWHIVNFSVIKWRQGSAVNGPVFKMDPSNQCSWKIKIGRKLQGSQYILSATVRKVTACENTSKFTFIWNVEFGKRREFLKKIVTMEAFEAYQDVFDAGISNLVSSIGSYEPINMMIQIEIGDSVAQPTTYGATCHRIRSSLDKGKLTVLGDMESMLKETAYSDITLRAQGKEIRAHKAILAARSTVFKSMFEHQMSEQASGVVDISDMSFDTLQQLVTYLYSGRLDDLVVESASELFVASDKYAVEDLHGTCSLFLETNMTVDNCLEILMMADLHSSAHLKGFAVDFFSGNSRKISEKPNWDDVLKVRPSVAFELFKVLAAK